MREPNWLMGQRAIRPVAAMLVIAMPHDVLVAGACDGADHGSGVEELDGAAVDGHCTTARACCLSTVIFWRASMKVSWAETRASAKSCDARCVIT